MYSFQVNGLPCRAGGKPEADLFVSTRAATKRRYQEHTIAAEGFLSMFWRLTSACCSMRSVLSSSPLAASNTAFSSRRCDARQGTPERNTSCASLVKDYKERDKLAEGASAVGEPL